MKYEQNMNKEGKKNTRRLLRLAICWWFWVTVFYEYSDIYSFSVYLGESSWLYAISVITLFVV